MKIHFQECKGSKEYKMREKKKLQTRLIMVNFKNTEGKENPNNFQRGRAYHLQRNKNQIDTRLKN